MKTKLILFLSVIVMVLSCEIQNKENSTTYYLIRHAEKENDGTKNPHLSKKGLERVEKLKTFFANKKINAVYSTDYWRTKETAIPIAEINSLSIELYNPDSLKIDSLIKKDKHKNVLIVGHSNTTPFLVNEILNESKYQVISEDVYNEIFIVKVNRKGEVIDEVIKID
ncbi:MAG: 2,3-bisphosphoglycerate-dependent phosphoglycerate mutase [Candidatus Azotimanducaceae bacterium]|jgi:2,3-bisphosphoglycerate-dependent phosphoglycerate mutase